jgi:uncharacterized protein
MELTIHDIKNKGWLIYEAIAGSRAYGLDTSTSDTDIRGVFVLPKDLYYSLDYIPQVSNERNDIVCYELKRFMELLGRNNPNIIELLAIPSQFVLYKDELMDRVRPEIFLSKLCESTFANYAFTQIKKAYGLEKKILNPVEETRKSILDFCFVYLGKETMSLNGFLQQASMQQEHVGLAAVPHLRDCYNMFYSTSHSYSGIMKKENSNDVNLSSIPKNEHPVGLLYFNKDGYSVYCKRHKEYWDWVEKRNEERYKNTLAHGKNYDSKNMMHVFRLLLMAKEIATEGKVNVYRQDRDFLLGIKEGKYEYDELVTRAEALKNELPALYASSGLPDEPDLGSINQMLVSIRAEYYDRNPG